MKDMEMRILANIVALAALLAVIAGVALHRRNVTRQRAEVVVVRHDVHRMERTIRVKAATGEVEVNGRGWPIDVDPAWFGDNPPHNPLLTPNRPWLEIASPDRASLEHPQVRIAFDRSVAAFWYNPANGVVRARVPVTVSDRRAVELYNSINSASLDSIFEGVGDRISFADEAEPSADSPDSTTTLAQPTIQPD